MDEIKVAKDAEEHKHRRVDHLFGAEHLDRSLGDGIERIRNHGTRGSNRQHVIDEADAVQRKHLPLECFSRLPIHHELASALGEPEEE